ncbi:sigma intracellular receptor 2-like [Candoia aspera]|uniref:sigma intracellular receptor 2-like n=1 Tax=Candoia aspera TaxID=51853 RepID=UPI002FD7B3D9
MGEAARGHLAVNWSALGRWDPAHLLPGGTRLFRFLTWYTTTVKDPLMGHPGPWFKSFLCMESIAPLFFFPVAAYAFWKGNCKWIRTPVVIYTTHVATAATACLAQILFAGFSNAQVPSPQTPWERLTLSAVDAPYLAIPLLMLLFVLFSPAYNQVEKRKKKTIGPPPSGREPCKLGKGRCVCVPRGQSLAKPSADPSAGKCSRRDLREPPGKGLMAQSSPKRCISRQGGTIAGQEKAAAQPLCGANCLG